DDIAGVFVAPDPLEFADRALEDVTRSLRHLPGSLGRMFNAPLQKFSGAADERRALESRTPQQAIATVLLGALLLVLVHLASEWFGLRGNVRATAEANDVERGFILRTFRHVTALPLSYFSLRSSQAVARQVDQADEISPIVMAVSKEIWPDAFSVVVILGILVSVNWELAPVSLGGGRGCGCVAGGVPRRSPPTAIGTAPPGTTCPAASSRPSRASRQSRRTVQASTKSPVSRVRPRRRTTPTCDGPGSRAGTRSCRTASSAPRRRACSRWAASGRSNTS